MEQFVKFVLGDSMDMTPDVFVRILFVLMVINLIALICSYLGGVRRWYILYL